MTILFFLILVLPGCEHESEEPELEISGELIANTGCKEFLKSSEVSGITPDTLSCIEYSFNAEDNTLTLKHINAGFNCCPEQLYCEVNSVGDSIMIEESEKSALCDCDCLYDLDIIIDGVVEGIYLIKVIEPYAREQEELLFQVDLSEKAAGSYCVVRKRYPWGIHSY